ncbi:MAG: response regulator transcription factor [Anaerolineae bacterium]|nr:response regulator transcription factor [Anaerolineae bacterium]
MISVYLADDHAVVRDGLRSLLEAHPGIRVVGDAATGSEAVQEIARLRPNVAVVDIAMPVLNGIEAARQVAQVSPDTRVIILSVHSSSEHVFRALQAGARGYLLKESAGAEVVDAVRAVALGERYLCRRVSDAITEDYVRYREAADADSPLARLSDREREVLQLVVEGRSSAEIAQRLFLSPKTVDTYRSRLMHKLGVHDVPGLVKFAIRHGVISLDG